MRARRGDTARANSASQPIGPSGQTSSISYANAERAQQATCSGWSSAFARTESSLGPSDLEPGALDVHRQYCIARPTLNAPQRAVAAGAGGKRSAYRERAPHQSVVAFPSSCSTYACIASQRSAHSAAINGSSRAASRPQRRWVTLPMLTRSTRRHR